MRPSLSQPAGVVLVSLREAAFRRPVLAAAGCALLQFALTIAILKGGMAALPPEAFGKVKMAAFVSTLALPLLLAQALGLWSRVGLKPAPLRLNPVFIAALALTTLPFLVLGVHAPKEGAGGVVAMQLFNAFGEELLFRGVIFALLIGLPRWGAITLNGLLFGSMHLIHAAMGDDWRVAAWKALITTGAGMMFTAVRYASASLWPVVALHMLLNLAMVFSNLPAASHTGAVIASRVVNVAELAIVAWVLFRMRPERARAAEAAA